MKCAFCEKTVDSVEAAIELDWYPDFWVGQVNYQGPICPECCSTYLVTDADGEYVLKPGCALPPAATPMTQTKLQSESPNHVGHKFPLGQVVATPDALKAIEDAGQTPDFFLDRHAQGDWGEVDAGDRQANDQALVDGSRILSAYRTLKSVRIWIITEAADDDGQREATTIILPFQY